MPNRVPGVHYTEAQHSSMRTSLSSAGVSWRTLIGYPSYARNRACALPSPLPFHYVMAKIVSVVKLAAHAKSSTLYVQIFSASCVLLFLITIGLRCARFARCEFRYNKHFMEYRTFTQWYLIRNILRKHAEPVSHNIFLI